MPSLRNPTKAMLGYSLSMICMRMTDAGKNGLPQYEIARRMDMGPSALSRMLNFKRYVSPSDIAAYCALRCNMFDANDFVRIGKQLANRTEITEAARAYIKAKGRKVRLKTGREFTQKIISFMLYKYDKSAPILRSIMSAQEKAHKEKS